MPISGRKVSKFLQETDWSKVYNKAGNTTQGNRLWPSGNKSDTKKLFRLDKGAKINDEAHEVVLQANKNAEDPEVKKSAQKNSHRVLGKIVINPKKPDPEKAQKDMKTSFDKTEK